ncbi:MAG: aminoglycoside phosphotransferase family protein [Streptomyces sp.]|jgi:aminoglycoside phosphotransferase (APT) family kinase protein|nr:aminoglycoside phosphotransferase family protein [Streptomyces sp.]
MGAPPALGVQGAPFGCVDEATGPRDLWEAVLGTADLLDESMGGYHNVNRVVHLSHEQSLALGRGPGTRVLVRRRRPGVPSVVIRTWTDESEVLKGIGGYLDNVPTFLTRRGEASIHSFMAGTPLASVCPDDKPIDSRIIDAFAELFKQFGEVPQDVLPPRPAYWPRDGDTAGYLRTLWAQADAQVRQPNWTEFGGLFVALGVREDALRKPSQWAPKMSSRPFSLLHGDLHRGNVVVTSGGKDVPPLMCVDWELASYGDPLHDLAVHLVRTHYPLDQRAEVVSCWRDAMLRARPAAVEGLDEDLRHYLDFEHAQSVYPDVIRAARSLGHVFSHSDLQTAAKEIRRALSVAQRPLALRTVLDENTIERLLYRWLFARGSVLRGSPSGRRALWTQDDRVPLRDDFPPSAVEAALQAEGRAPARRVFNGTAHLATVVKIEGCAPVMVRRKVGTAQPIEPRFLNEHEVLRVIEDSGVAVKAPRVYALGTSDFGDPFAIHSYVGSPDTRRAPRHPVRGLVLPGEAYSLVDQLCELARVDSSGLQAQQQMGPGEDFYVWLSSQLVHMVRSLSRRSKDVAAMVGLPFASELRDRLSRHRVTPRPYGLLHGDLNPWNLVRLESGYGLALIDWEMAMIGDPLYDLVRHIHLTPTTRELRERMYGRWARLMPREQRLGWESDVAVYRGLERVRSAYVDLDRLVTGAALDAPNVRRAVGSYATTLRKALDWLDMPRASRTVGNPYLALALPHADHEVLGASEARFPG